MKPIDLRDDEVRGFLDGTRRMVVRPMKPQPRTSPSHHTWVCVGDPWHSDAFVGTPAEGIAGRGGPRQDVWWSEDWCGNLIGEYGPSPFGSPGEQIAPGIFTKSVRVVRVQEISEEDAASMLESHVDDGVTYYGPFDNGHASAACELRRQWTKHHGKSYPWDSNPWAWLGEVTAALTEGGDGHA